jgi:hypothetical protein
MIAIKNQTVSVNINGVEFNIDIDVAIKAGIAKPVRTHKVGNYYRNIVSGDIYMLISYYYGRNRVSLVRLTGFNPGMLISPTIVFDVNNITEAEFTYMTHTSSRLEQIDNPLVK